MAELLPDNLDTRDPLVAAALAQMALAYRPLRRELSPAQKLRRIAEVMVERVAGEGACTEADLAAAGFTPHDLALYGSAAQALARRMTMERRP